MELALDALIKIYSPIAPVRLGLRYVDTIRKDVVAAGLKREIEWKDLISPEFLRLPGELADLQETRFMQLIESPLESGLLTLRYGIIAEAPSNQLVYRLDSDRYMMGGFETGQIVEKLDTFATDIYSIFRAVAEDALIEWMQPVTS
jgi:uncharacterized protein (TIGR04255 family)